MDTLWNEETPLATIALLDPALAATLDRLGLDYCCHGQARLRDACALGGRCLASVLEELAAVAARRPPGRGPRPRDFRLAPLGDLVDYVEATHHRFTRSSLADIDQLLSRVLRVHGTRHPELTRVATLVGDLAEDLAPHMRKEERVLFPYIRALAAGQPASAPFATVRMPIAAMETEHARGGRLLAALEEATGDFTPPPDACASYRALYDALTALRQDLLLHVALENHVLFPRVLALAEDRVAV
jgi:regulator of cell morphogenesis and NO signaling